jgi:hypothetical protein
MIECRLAKPHGLLPIGRAYSKKGGNAEASPTSALRASVGRPRERKGRQRASVAAQITRFPDFQISK